MINLYYYVLIVIFFTFYFGYPHVIGIIITIIIFIVKQVSLVYFRIHTSLLVARGVTIASPCSLCLPLTMVC